MKITSLVLFIALSALSTLTSNAHADNESDDRAVRNCIASWKNAPFDTKNLNYKTLSTSVKVLGIGGTTSDNNSTDKPNLVLIKSNVAVLSKAEVKLLNPNGWYCIKGQVAVLGKSQIIMDCHAHLASSKDGATVLGGSDEHTGVTVLGSSRVETTGNCAK